MFRVHAGFLFLMLDMLLVFMHKDDGRISVFLSLLYDMHWENIHILITVWVLTEAPSHAMQMKLNESDLLKKSSLSTSLLHGFVLICFPNLSFQCLSEDVRSV